MRNIIVSAAPPLDATNEATGAVGRHPSAPKTIRFPRPSN